MKSLEPPPQQTNAAQGDPPLVLKGAVQPVQRTLANFGVTTLAPGIANTRKCLKPRLSLSGNALRVPGDHLGHAAITNTPISSVSAVTPRLPTGSQAAAKSPAHHVQEMCAAALQLAPPKMGPKSTQATALLYHAGSQQRKLHRPNSRRTLLAPSPKERLHLHLHLRPAPLRSRGRLEISSHSDVSATRRQA